MDWEKRFKEARAAKRVNGEMILDREEGKKEIICELIETLWDGAHKTPECVHGFLLISNRQDDTNIFWIESGIVPTDVRNMNVEDVVKAMAAYLDIDITEEMTLEFEDAWGFHYEALGDPYDNDWRIVGTLDELFEALLEEAHRLGLMDE